MKTSAWKILFAAILAAAGLVWQALSLAGEAMQTDSIAGAALAKEAPTATWYTCGMHPEVIQDHPGNCPKCGMKLQPMAPDRAAAMGLTSVAGGNEATPGQRKVLYWKSSMIPGEIHPAPGKDSMGMDLVPVYEDEVSTANRIVIDPVTEQNMGIRVDTVKRGPLVRKVRTVGSVEYDERSLGIVTTKVDGWIEKLHVDATGVQIHAGDPLFEIYSPELFSAQEEYLSALRNLRRGEVAGIPRSRLDAETLVRDARTRLEYFDISAREIAQIERSGTPRKTLTIRSPFTGIAIDKQVVEGQRVTAGMELYRIADLSTVWVIGKVFEHDAPYVALGQQALMTLAYLPGKTFRGRVAYVYPYLQKKTREIPVRMEFHNPGYELKPGMYATITLTHEVDANAVLVPDVAVIQTGLRSVAFVMPEPGRFEPRQVELGPRGEDNHLQVLSGLLPGETVVVSGQFLLDSESRLREAALKFLRPGRVDGAQPIEAATAAATQPNGSATVRERTYHVCPMPEHVDILYDKPGRCPLCGMALVPSTRNEIEVAAAAYWTCPMPEHAQVRESSPGECPLCGMDLVPATSEPTAPSSGGHDHGH